MCCITADTTHTDLTVGHVSLSYAWVRCLLLVEVSLPLKIIPSRTAIGENLCRHDVSNDEQIVKIICSDIMPNVSVTNSIRRSSDSSTMITTFEQETPMKARLTDYRHFPATPATIKSRDWSQLSQISRSLWGRFKSGSSCFLIMSTCTILVSEFSDLVHHSSQDAGSR